MERRLVNRFSELLMVKARRENRKIHLREVSRETGIAPNTLTSYARNEVMRYDARVLNTLCAYLSCDIVDFLIFEEIEAPEKGTPLLATA